MLKTYMAKKQEVKRKWYLIDAKDKILGRVATKAATILRGKHKTIYTPHVDTGDYVIITNASLVKVTGRKMSDKIYRRYSGYPGGLREVTLDTMLTKRPATVMQLAVQRMLPAGSLAKQMVKKLKIYADGKHAFEGQKIEVLEVK